MLAQQIRVIESAIDIDFWCIRRPIPIPTRAVLMLRRTILRLIESLVLVDARTRINIHHQPRTYDGRRVRGG